MYRSSITDFDILKLHKYWIHISKKYGPIFQMEAFGQRLVCVTDPDDIKKLFEKTKDNPLRPAMSSIQKVRLEKSNGFFENKCGVILE